MNKTTFNQVNVKNNQLYIALTMQSKVVWQYMHPIVNMQKYTHGGLPATPAESTETMIDHDRNVEQQGVHHSSMYLWQ